MEYNDNLLDVNAYLQDKIKKNLEASKAVAEGLTETEASFASMEAQIDELTAEASKIAEEMGVDLSEIATQVEEPESDEEDNNEEKNRIHIRISANYNYSEAFRNLLTKAHEEGFVSVQPQSILTEEEIRRAEEFSAALDEEFSLQTKLTSKDIQVLVVSVAVRVLYFYILKLFAVGDGSADSQDVAPAMSLEPEIDAMQNVDIGKVDGNESIRMLMNLIGNGFVDFKSIKSERQVLNDNLPFDLQDNDFFMRKDILAYHPMIGWLIGVINILTDTVTTSKFESFAVTKSLYDDNLYLERTKNLGVLLPVMFDFTKHKDSLLAAVVRQADALNVTSAPIDDVSVMLKETIAMEEHNFDVMDKADTLLSIIPFDLSSISLGGIFRDAAVTAFFNKLTTAIHAVRYNPENDGDLRMYTVRTNKIIAISSAIATSVNSLPALITEDFRKIDISGVIMSLISLFNSTRFWIKVKTDYLVSEYKVEIDKAFKEIDKYFEVIPDSDT